MSGWQPMSTAPKSEIQFLCFTATGRMFVGYYKFNPRRNNGAGAWQLVGPSLPNDGHVPTAWMPLPEAPK